MLVIEKIKEKADVFDITVEGNNNFYANGILVHNCTEILLHTKETKYDRYIQYDEVGETAVCNLGSVNISAHIKDGVFDEEGIAKTIATGMRMLDNVIDINYYPTREAELSNLANRPVGLGIMGFHTALHMINLPYDSDAAVRFSDELQELVSRCAIISSIRLAEERGPYPNYEGSLWSKGKVPLDTYKDFMRRHRPGVEANEENKHDWTLVRAMLKEHGIRNGNTMAIAPTATIAGIVGVSPSIEPDYKMLFAESTLSGEFTQVNRYFVKDMKELGLWGQELLDALKAADGLVTHIEGIPAKYKRKYKTAFEVPAERLVDCAAARQKWIDMGQSLNLYYDYAERGHKGASLKYLSNIYTRAWKAGLKTTYYLRSKAASSVEKSTGTAGGSAEVQAALGDACPIDAGPDCEACQ